MLQNYLSQTHKTEVRPRYTFKRKYKAHDGQESFEMIDIPSPNVDPSYKRWHQSQILDDLKL